MKKLTFILAFALLTSASACNQTETKSEENQATESQKSAPKHVRSTEAKTLLTEDEEVVILDVRTPEEFSGGHLQKAVNIDYQSPGFAEELEKLDPNKKYLVYCAVGGRSAKAVALMEEKGFAQVYNCEEGFEDLKKEGVPTE